METDTMNTSLSIKGESMIQQEDMAKWVRILFPFPHKIMGKKCLELRMEATVTYKVESHKSQQESKQE